MKQLFAEHLTQLQQTAQQALEMAKLEGLWIYAGSAKAHFLDDQYAPFKINPHFNYFFPDPNAEHSWLYIDGKNRPKIYFYAPEDYWHLAPNPPVDAFFADAFDWQILTDTQQIAHYIQAKHCAFIGEIGEEAFATHLGFSQINPQKILNIFHFARSTKTAFEIECLYQAQLIALQGHQAAKQAFFAGKSEFEINLAYLQATQQSDNNVPYGNIVAINQHSAILHYTKLAIQAPTQQHSFLLDAGATFLGYASDITRSYAFDLQSEFSALIQKIDQFKLDTIANLQVGINYLHYHTQMHQWISQLLADFELVKLPADQIFEQGISRIFFPHGLGHPLGLQVHDVAGFQQNPRGTHKAPPEIYPSLRCTRELAEGMVLTIEPGFYFIEMLQKPWQNSPLARHFNWQKLAELHKFGGIRSEDNVVMRSDGAENLTAKAEQTLANQ